MQPSTEYTTDVLVIGSGAAGLSLALRLAGHCEVMVLSKGSLDEGFTLYAQGGITAVFDETDNVYSHVEYTLIAGASVCDREAVELLPATPATVCSGSSIMAYCSTPKLRRRPAIATTSPVRASTATAASSIQILERCNAGESGYVQPHRAVWYPAGGGGLYLEQRRRGSGTVPRVRWCLPPTARPRFINTPPTRYFLR